MGPVLETIENALRDAGLNKSSLMRVCVRVASQ
jgi:hypothetical protein